MKIKEIQEEIIAEFSELDDWMDRYQLLIDMGNELAPLDDKYKVEQNLIDGCQSRVWIVCEENNGKLLFQADSDALIVKGIIALIIRVFNNQSADDILDTELDFIDAIGLKEHLSPTRSNGLLAMIKQIRIYALAFKVCSINSKMSSQYNL